MNNAQHLAEPGDTGRPETQGSDARKGRHYILGRRRALVLGYVFLGVLCGLGLLFWRYRSRILRVGSRVVLIGKAILGKKDMTMLLDEHTLTTPTASSAMTPPT